MTLQDYTVKGVAADMTKEAFLQVLREASSPIPAAEAGAVYDYCVARRSSVAFLLGMVHHESTYGRFGSAAETHSWGNTRPPAIGALHIGVTARNFSIFRNWLDGGVSTVARWMDYVPYWGKDTVATIIPTWAPPIENSTERYIAAVLADIERWVQPQEPSMAPKIALASGHHNSSGGDAFERQQTGPLCAAVAQHCRALGMDVRVVQPDDGMGYITGSLDAVGNTVTAWARQGWEPDIFLETHTEGGGGRGAFAIYPDWAPDVDEAVRDDLGPMVAAIVSNATGLALGAGGDGVMSEKQTGVGGQGSRLGIFRTTATLQATRRLIIEYGAHDRQPDLGIATAPGFADKCGQATAEAFADYLGWGGSLAANGGIYAAHQRLWNGGIYAAHTALWG